MASIISGSAQDIHFSQFYASPLSLNPAHTGCYNGDWRFMNNYRNQWRSLHVPFRTISAGFDRQFHLYNENFSAGIFILNDQSGNASLKLNKIYLSVAYHKKIQSHTLHFGIQGGYALRDFSYEKLAFPEQWDMTMGKFNNQLPNNEIILDPKSGCFDLNAGVIWSKKFKGIEPQVGFAVFHINQPQESFLGNSNSLPMRQVAHTDIFIPLGKKFFVVPKALYMSHKKANDMLFGTNFGYYLPERFQYIKLKSVFTGFYFRDGYKRNSDAAIAIIGVNFFHLDLGFSYDFNISELRQATHSRGAFEISLIYTALSTIPTKITIPCDRF
jgi:type IX secretion system PorP/SprF family membrane protein